MHRFGAGLCVRGILIIIANSIDYYYPKRWLINWKQMRYDMFSHKRLISPGIPFHSNLIASLAFSLILKIYHWISIANIAMATTNQNQFQSNKTIPMIENPYFIWIKWCIVHWQMNHINGQYLKLHLDILDFDRFKLTTLVLIKRLF